MATPGIQNKRFQSGRFRRDRGSALISALALVAITALLLSGICVLATSHATRQRREADYALAMQLAEAGINYELRYVSTHLSTAPYGHLSASPYTGTVPGVVGSFTVFVRNTDGTTNWAPPKDAQIVATGTVGGISRTVAVNCKGGGGKSIFDGEFALYGYSSVTFSGASSAINGDLGSNGEITVKSNGNGTINGDIVLAGPGASTPNNNSVTGRNKVYLTEPIRWPTIETIVAGTFQNGWSDLTSVAAIAAQSARMRTYKINSPVLTLLGTKPAGLTNVTTLSNNMFNSLNVNTLILPPGDYYFTDIQVTGTKTIVCDTAAITTGGTPGPVRIWVNGTGNQDTLNCDVMFTQPSDPRWFRLYYNKANDLSLAGNMTYFGGIYAVRAADSAAIAKASISIAGGGKVTGMVIADEVKLTGGGVVTGPTSDMSNSTDYRTGSTLYGFSDTWQELSITANGRVFSDGTNR